MTFATRPQPKKTQQQLCSPGFFSNLNLFEDMEWCGDVCETLVGFVMDGVFLDVLSSAWLQGITLNVGSSSCCCCPSVIVPSNLCHGCSLFVASTATKLVVMTWSLWSLSIGQKCPVVLLSCHIILVELTFSWHQSLSSPSSTCNSKVNTIFWHVHRSSPCNTPRLCHAISL